MKKLYLHIYTLLLSLFIFSAADAQIRITEYQYNGSEFVELTNVGASSINMTGWSFDDNSRTAGSFSISAFGSVATGESVIICEATAAAFKTLWNLCDGVKVIGSNTQNLGRADEINIYDNNNLLVDRLTYDDQGASPLGGPRTDVNSAWVPSTAMGNNTHNAWILSSLNDAEGSFASGSGGFIASPGKSARATVPYNPCNVTGNAPVILIDVAATSNLVDAGATVSPLSPFAVSGVINDNSDPLKTAGIDFIVNDDATPVASLTVTATSSNQSVITNSHLILTGTGANRKLQVTPSGVGYSNINITVTDAENNSSSFILAYAASASTSNAYYWPTGIADASAAIELDENYMVLANDETNLLYVYNRKASGQPVKTIDINPGNVLNLTDGSAGNWKEIDIEAAASSRNISNRVYWMGSLSNGSDGDTKVNRNRIFATTVTGTGTGTTISNSGSYNNLRAALISWGNTNGYNLSASAQNGHDPKTIDGFNVEGMVFAPDGTTLYIGFRAPLVPTGNRTKALIAPIQHFETWFNNGNPSGNPVIGNPIELNLGNRGIRDMIRLNNGTYVIVAGSYNNNSIPAIFRWSGNAGDEPLLVPSFNLAGLNAEALLPVPEGGSQSFDKLQIICDNGDTIFYNDGIAAKDLANDSHKKFINHIAQSAEGNVLPVSFTAFTADRTNNNVRLHWEYNSSSPVTRFEILRSPDGIDFGIIATVNAVPQQSNLTYRDSTAPAMRLYYRIIATDASGRNYVSDTKSVDGNPGENITAVFPNPAHNRFYVSCAVEGFKTITVMNSTGMLVKKTGYTGTIKEIDIPGWSKGIYFVTIYNEEGKTIKQQKLIVH